MNDVFKDMQVKVGCDYLSDLPSYKRKVWQEMKRLNPANYEERQLEDFSKYVFGMSYQTLKDVMKQQKGREEQCRKQGCWWKREEQLAKKQYVCEMASHGDCTPRPFQKKASDPRSDPRATVGKVVLPRPILTE